MEAGQTDFPYDRYAHNITSYSDNPLLSLSGGNGGGLDSLQCPDLGH